ncbi:MAG: Crp/Fnr family transcriptional regulator [Terracidiphilus sp.]
MQARQVVRAAAHPLAELLDCPPETASLLSAATETLNFEAGNTIFCQGEACRGLYVVLAGQLQRRTERLDARLTLGQVRAGELVELAAVLGDGQHTYTLKAVSGGTMLLLPMVALEDAFRAHPPLRMQLLEELAREVSRAYEACFAARMAGLRRRRVETSYPSGLQGTR